MKLEPFTLPHFKAYTKLMLLDTGNQWILEPFQEEIASDIFSGNPETWVLIPEGNAKTTMMAGFGLYHLDFTDFAACNLAASSRDQAGILFEQARDLIDRSPGFNARFQVHEGLRVIKSKRHAGRIKVFAADERTGDGVIPTLCLLDELHRHKDLRLYRTWRGKLQKRPGAQIVAISTAGEPGTEFEDARKKIKQMAIEKSADGYHTRYRTRTTVLHEWQVPKDADVEDMEVVKGANPLQSITPQVLRDKRDSAAMTLTHWRRISCNQATRGEDTAITLEEWNRWYTTLDPLEALEADMDVGLDLGWKWDTTAATPMYELIRRVDAAGAPDDPIGEDEEVEHHFVLDAPKVLVPPRDGNSLDPNLIKLAFRQILKVHPIRRVVMDPDRGAEIAAWLETEENEDSYTGWCEEMGLDPEDFEPWPGVEVVPYSQKPQPMGIAYETFMETGRNGRLHQTGDETLQEHALNAIAKVAPDGSAKFDRPSSSRAPAGQRRRVIDALIASAIVVAVAEAEAGAGGDYVQSFDPEEFT